MQREGAHELHEEGPQPELSRRRLADGGERGKQAGIRVPPAAPELLAELQQALLQHAVRHFPPAGVNRWSRQNESWCCEMKNETVIQK